MKPPFDAFDWWTLGELFVAFAFVCILWGVVLRFLFSAIVPGR